MKKIENNMNFNEYQEKTLITAKYPEKYKIVYPALGLAGETGEVIEKIKKLVRNDDFVLSEQKKQLLSKELGDVLWYLAALARDLDLSLQDVAEQNIEKALDRKERGVLHGSGDER